MSCSVEGMWVDTHCANEKGGGKKGEGDVSGAKRIWGRITYGELKSLSCGGPLLRIDLQQGKYEILGYRRVQSRNKFGASFCKNQS